MIRHPRQPMVVLLGLALVLSGVGSAPAAITLTANPPAPGFPDIHVTDALAFGNIANAFVEDRMMRQTFTNSSTLDIGEIILSLNLNGTDGSANEGAGEGGLIINLYTVEDVNGPDWTAATPSISPIKTWTVPPTTSIPATDGRLSVSLTGTDVFTLPQRDTGAQGYGLEIASVDGVTNMGQWHVTPNDEIDRYPDGVFYLQTGNVSRAFRDAGLSIFAVGNSSIPALGDVTGDGMAQIEDFNIISGNFRTVVGARTQGDLTGDGLVGFDDFREWKANATPLSLLQAGFKVPEPTSATLLTMSGVLLTCVGRRRRQRAEASTPAYFVTPRREARHPSIILAFSAILLMLVGQSVSEAVVTLEADPEYPTGVDLGAMTLDPEGFGPAQRGIAGTRQLRQTFLVDTTFNVGGAVLAADMNGTSGGLILDFFEVADVNADTWDPVGNPIKTITVPVGDPIPDTTLRLGMSFTGFDTFTLPALTSPAGYGIEISNGDESSSIGLVRHSNNGTDNYTDGKFYIENDLPSGGSTSGRDWGIALVTTTEIPPLPGDTEPDGDVDLDDLTTIRGNFFMENAGPTDGDFNGDTVVSFEDFEIWKSNFPSPLATFSTSVPEPGSALLAMLGSVCLLQSRRGRSQRAS